MTSQTTPEKSGGRSKTEAVLKGGKFIPPRHWVDLEELSLNYWTNERAQEQRGQEFLHKPVETVDMLTRADAQGLARRDFLTIMGASMAMATFACARRPVNKIIPYVVKPEEIVPGVPTWYSSSISDGMDGVGLLVKTREGRPIKLDGNPDHPVNRGKLSSRGQAALLDLYDPDRMRNPVSRKRGEEFTQKVSWTEVDQKVGQALKGARKVRVLTGEVRSPSTRRLVREFLDGFSDGRHVAFEPAAFDQLAQAQKESYGNYGVPTYRFDKADVVVSVGADFLGDWVSPVEHARQWATRRKLDGTQPKKANLSKFYCFEPGFSITGSSADERYGIRSGDEVKIVLALAHEIIVRRSNSSFAGNGDVSDALRPFAAGKVAQDVGGHVTEELLVRVARDLWDHRGASLVVAGSPVDRNADSMALQIAVNLLNSALKNEGETVDGVRHPMDLVSSWSDFNQLLDEMGAGDVDVLLVHRANPFYWLGEDHPRLKKAFEKVKMVVFVGDRLTETDLWADYVLPDHHFLENWGDTEARKNVVGIQQPVISPIHSSRSFQESLLAWIKGGVNGAGLSGKVASAGGKNPWHDYVKANWRAVYYPSRGGGRSFEKFWVEVLQTGWLGGPSELGEGSSARGFRVSSLKALPRTVRHQEGMVLGVYAKPSMGDGTSANNAWLQELPDGVTSVTWDNYLNVAPSVAKDMALVTNDVVRIQAGDKAIEVPVVVQPGMHPASVTLAVGYGRTRAGKVGNGNGVNAYALGYDQKGEWNTSSLGVQLTKTGQRYELARTQEHFRSENRPILNDITYGDFKKDPGAAAHTDPHLRMANPPTLWTKHKYDPDYRWGMVVDLNSCTGCSACMVACQAENNIPVVGRDRVRYSREMHWIRIDRYYSGNPENPQVLFQPMMCQHCENAPCETVCPVLATTHSTQGLNEMTYNRCVGTRYCQNNCPYKVRRFNFFDHWKSYEKPMDLVWNPDVTVRSRGVMEKCTFCIQRINDTRRVAIHEGRKIRDGELKTACQQTCPTDAIIFGNIHDPKSQVVKLKKDPRAFRVLEILNTLPSISYLTKVRNVAGGSHGSAHGDHGKGAENGH